MGSIGEGTKAVVPWLALMETRHSSTVSSGVYLVYLFTEDGSAVYLAVTQGRTDHSFESMVLGRTELFSKAVEMIAPFSGLTQSGFEMGSRSLAYSEASLAKGYGTRPIVAKKYDRDAMPPDTQLEQDLSIALEFYERYVESLLPSREVESIQPTPPHPEKEPTPPVCLKRRFDMDQLAAEILWPLDRVTEICEAIRKGEQVILAGPPGTGKSHVAIKVAEFLTQGEEQQLRIVQFHPSYSYEDFMEGLRPVTNANGTIVFAPVDGVVLDLCRKAVEPGPHIIFVDEINRANLPRVLGELLLLFEYRDMAIDLRFTKNFRLPRSVRFLGTMNTADRSIRSIDTALRRRFYIWECPPDAGILERWYADHANEVPSLIDGFKDLNRKLAADLDSHHTIGHTFFMGQTMTREHLKRTWHHKVRPIIEEYFFDAPEQANQYEVSLFWPERDQA
jgi:MoxR-like ATPase